MNPSRPEGQIGVLASHIHYHLVPLALQNQLPWNILLTDYAYAEFVFAFAEEQLLYDVLQGVDLAWAGELSHHVLVDGLAHFLGRWA